MITNESITLWHATVDPKTRMHTYTIQRFSKISLQKDVMTNLADGGLKSANVLKIRIPTEKSIAISNGDKLIVGLSNEASPPAKNSYTVMGFADNRKGNKNIRHWKVIAG